MLGVNKQKLPTVLVTLAASMLWGLEAEAGVRTFFSFSIALTILSTPLVLSAELFHPGPLLY